MSNQTRQSVWLGTLTAIFVFATSAVAGVQTRVEEGVANSFRAARAKNGHVTIANVPLQDQERGTLELDRFSIYTPDSVVVVFGANGPTRLAPPNISFFRGKVAGDDSSLAFVSISDDAVNGFVMTHDRKLFLASHPKRGPRQRDEADVEVTVEEATPSDDYDAQGTFECLLDKESMTQPDLLRVMSGEYKAQSIATGTATYVANVAVDTDYQLRVKLGSTAAVTSYIANLVAAASTIYLRDLRTELVIRYQSSFDTATDPFTVTPLGNGTGAAGSPTLGDALRQLGQVWHTGAAPRNISRSAAMLVSGKTFADSPGSSGGIAWLQTLCSGDFVSNSANVAGTSYGGAYGMLNGAGGTGVVPNPNQNPNYTATTSIFDNNYWTLLAFTHELGHVVQSSHTHCITLSAPDQTLYGRTYVDTCYSGEGGCYSNGSFTGGTNTPPAEKGTIMSYCHIPDCHTGNCNGGYGTATRYTFGQTGEASHVVVDAMKARLNSITPALSAITAPSSVSASSAGNAASITAIPGATYVWSITNGTITSATTGNAITFTAGATGTVSLKVVATGSNGCGASDTVGITITAPQQQCSYVASPTLYGTVSPAGMTTTFSLTTTCAWSASSTVPFIIVNTPNGTGSANISFTVQVNKTAAQRSGAILVNGQTVIIRQNGRVRGDFNGDGWPDLVWRNTATGANRLWIMDGGVNVTSTVALPTVADLTWTIAGVGDFNGDGYQDLLWRNTSSGANVIWLMNGTTYTNTSTSLPTVPTTSYVGSVVDFNHDGNYDIVWRNNATGQNSVWIMSGTAYSSTTNLTHLVADPNWRIVGTGQFNPQDIDEDIMWRNSVTGQNVLFFMHGADTWYTTGWQTVADQNWKADAAVSLSYDDVVDLVWRNYSDGQVAVWYQAGGEVGSSGALPYEYDLNWHIVGPK
jgi:hypothetical protein